MDLRYLFKAIVLGLAFFVCASATALAQNCAQYPKSMPCIPPVVNLQRTDILTVWQPAQGPSAHRAQPSDIFTLLNSGDVVTALGFTPYSSLGGTIAGSATVNGLLSGLSGATLSAGGNWSAFNWGKQLKLTTPPGFSSPAIDFTDATGANDLGIANGGGVLQFATMPPQSNSTTPPNIVFTMGATGANALGTRFQVGATGVNTLLSGNENGLQIEYNQGANVALAGTGGPNVLNCCNVTYSGSSGAHDVNAMFFGMVDNADASLAPNGVFFLNLQMALGASAKGSASPLVSSVVANNPMAASTADLSSGNFWSFAGANAGGTGSGSLASGAMFGINPQCELTSGATFWVECSGLEADVGVSAGASTDETTGVKAILLSTHAVQGTNGTDSGFLIGAQNGATAFFNYGVLTGGLSGQWPIHSTNGVLFGTVVQTACGGFNRNCDMMQQQALGGVDLENVSFSGYAMKWPGGSFSGSGVQSVGAATITPTATGLTIDAANFIVQGTPTVVAGGSAIGNGFNNYYPGDLLYGPGNVVKGQYPIATTKALVATIAAAGTGGTAGAQTVTGTTGTGTKFQASVTVAGGAMTAVNSISLAGSYTVNPTNPASEPVTGGGLSGAKLDVGMGASTISPTRLVPDVNTTTLTGTQATTGGSGVGATLSMTTAQGSLIALGGTSGVTAELAQFTVAGLPTCNAGTKGKIASVTDATTPAYNATLVGGGAVSVMSYCNGTSWAAH